MAKMSTSSLNGWQVIYESFGLSFEAYLLAVAQGIIAIYWYIVGAIEHMWNLSISIISPCYATE